jgi:hypothetical protein
MGTGSLPGVKSGRGVTLAPIPPSSAVGHKRVDLYLYSPYGPYGLYRASVPVQRWPLPLPLQWLSQSLVYNFTFLAQIFLKTSCFQSRRDLFKIYFNIILQSTFRYIQQSFFFTSPHPNPIYTSVDHHTSYTSSPSQPYSSDQPNIWWGVQIIKFLILHIFQIHILSASLDQISVSAVYFPVRMAFVGPWHKKVRFRTPIKQQAKLPVFTEAIQILFNH